MSEPVSTPIPPSIPSTTPSATAPTAERWYQRIGVDWWATIVAGVIALLAVAGVLPKIGW